MNDILYELKGVSYSYMSRFPALRDIDLCVNKGARLVLLGANGSGKSTLLLMLAALIFPHSGSIKYCGSNISEEIFRDEAYSTFFRSSVGIVFQNSDVQLFNSNVEDEIMFGLTQLNIAQSEAGDRVKKYMELMDISHLKDRHPHFMSLGEKKRVAIASVLAMEPKVILLDEPTAGLDPRTSRHLIETIVSLDGEHTVITATQDIHIASEIADSAVIMTEDKKIAESGGVSDILEKRELLEKHNLIHSHVHSHAGKMHAHPHEHPSHDHPHKD